MNWPNESVVGTYPGSSSKRKSHGVPGRWCSCSNPMAWPNSCRATADQSLGKDWSNPSRLSDSSPGFEIDGIDAIVGDKGVEPRLVERDADLGREGRVRRLPGPVLAGGRVDPEVERQVGVVRPFVDRVGDLFVERSVAATERDLQGLPGAATVWTR